MDKQTLVRNIKEWVKLDNEINTLNAEIKKRKTAKKELTTDLMEFMKTQEIDCFILMMENSIHLLKLTVHYKNSLLKH